MSFDSLFHSNCRENGNIKFLTKGDNSSADDRGLYALDSCGLKERMLLEGLEGELTGDSIVIFKKKLNSHSAKC